MKKKRLVSVLAGGSVATCMGVRALRRLNGGEATSHLMRERMENRMRQRMERMPVDFPPRIVREDVPAIRANTEEILELLRQQRPQQVESETVPPARR